MHAAAGESWGAVSWHGRHGALETSWLSWREGKCGASLAPSPHREEELGQTLEGEAGAELESGAKELLLVGMTLPGDPVL